MRVLVESIMMSREHKRAVLHEKLQLLRSVTHSHAIDTPSIIVDATKYIEELKQKVDKLNEEIAEDNASLPMVTVETLEKGFMINVFSEKSFPGLLINILAVFEDLGLNVLDARASCADIFRFEAVSGENQSENVDEEVVKQAVIEAMKNCSGSSE